MIYFLSNLAYYGLKYWFGCITKEEFWKEIKQSLAINAGRFIGGTIGGFLGLLVGYPHIGSFLGGMIGDFIGSVIGYLWASNDD